MKRFWTVTILSLFASLTLSAAGIPKPEAADTRPTVLAFCDSITHGYSGYLQDRMNQHWNIIRQGFGGETSFGGLARLITYLENNPAPTVAVIMYGTNDAIHGAMMGETQHTPEMVAQNMLQMADMLTSRGTIVFLGYPLGVAPAREGLSDENNRNLRLLQGFLDDTRIAIKKSKGSYRIVDFRIQDRKYYADAFHMTEAGNGILVNRIVNGLNKVLD